MWSANAGVGQPIPLGSITEEHFDKTFTPMSRSTFHCAEGTATDEGATIILNASTASIVGTPAFSVYGATKAAVRRLPAHSTLKNAKRVNAISPGMVPTPGYDQFGFSEEQAKEFVESQANIPLGRVGTPDEIAKAVVFFSLPPALQRLSLDGGMAQI